MLLFCPESLLYLITKGNLKEAFEVYKKLCPNNENEKENFFRILSDSDVESLLNTEENEEKDSFIVVAKSSNDNNKGRSILIIYSVIMTLSFMNSYLMQGIRYILPKTLMKIFDKDISKVNLELKVSAILEFCAAIVTGVFIELPYFKRLKLLVLSIFGAGFFSLFGYVTPKYLDIFACSLKPILTIQDQVLEVYASEVFETQSRVFLLSIYNIFNSIPNFISPYFNDVMNENDFELTYLIFGIFSVVMLIMASTMLKKETFRETLK